ncbi:MAG: iron chaperone, partial [Acidimicrobiia bacterium]
MASPAPDIDEFLANLPPDVQAVLQQLRETIRHAAPEAEDRFGYGVPAFYYKKRPLVSYAAGKIHCAFYVQS